MFSSFLSIISDKAILYTAAIVAAIIAVGVTIFYFPIILVIGLIGILGAFVVSMVIGGVYSEVKHGIRSRNYEKTGKYCD
jgi:hypothetical protein